ncbi:MAG: tetratricopeptide repeat protein [Heliomarina sp.]|uniref:tetratricopeptide repeat protein n=1 Tax=Heliomarina sp. TaxID=2917556 RepID=UPI004058F7F1
MLSLLDKRIAQAVKERSAIDAATCEVEKIEIEYPDQEARFYALRSVSMDWVGPVRREDSIFELEVAIELSRACSKYATSPYETGIAMDDLGIALWSLGKRETGTARLEESVAAHRVALDEFSRETEPLDWAKTQNNLGNALQSLGQRENDTQRLEQAVTAFRAALEERTREIVPRHWAITQNNLGTALNALGQRYREPTLLEQAVFAYRAALEERTREEAPLEWAMTKSNLGNALRALGEHERGTERLEDARACFCAALKEYTREKFPLDWATTKGNLGRLEIAFFNKTGDPTHLDRAEAHVRAAREVFAEGNATQYLGMADQQLGYINHLRKGPSA